MKILVTGCAGFIGFHVSRALLARGDDVIGIDNMNKYYDPSLKKARLRLLKEHPQFKFYKKDISKKIILDENPDKICHLAAQAGVRYSFENPLIYEKYNLLGTLNIFEYARENKIKNVVYASSSSVYGNTKETPFRENMTLDEPISLYAATKKSNELMAYTYHHLFNINMIGLRFFTVYGPWGRPDMALFTFTKNIIENQPIKLYNHGNLFRDFTYITDIVDGITKSIDSDYKYEIFNLARGEPIKISDFLSEIEKNLDKKAIILNEQKQPGDVDITFGDITKAKKMLNYEPKISIDKGIKEFVDWYKEYYKL